MVVHMVLIPGHVKIQVYEVPRTFEAAALLPVARTPGLQDLQGGHKAAGSDIIRTQPTWQW